MKAGRWIWWLVTRASGGGLALFGCSGILGIEHATLRAHADSGAAGREDCLNGVDDDGNGLVDCAYPACGAAGFACAPAPPDGWSLVAMYRYEYKRAPSTAPCAAPSRHLTGLAAPIAPAECGACMCNLAPYCS